MCPPIRLSSDQFFWLRLVCTFEIKHVFCVVFARITPFLVQGPRHWFSGLGWAGTMMPILRFVPLTGYLYTLRCRATPRYAPVQDSRENRRPRRDGGYDRLEKEQRSIVNVPKSPGLLPLTQREKGSQKATLLGLYCLSLSIIPGKEHPIH